MGRFLAFGEILLRLSPPNRELVLQSPRFDTWFGGAEANVATALAVLGHDVALASALPHGALGDAGLHMLRGHGIDCRTVTRRDGRMGLYFVIPGAGFRATEVFYDRDASAFSLMSAAEWNWDAMFDGVDRLHLSGITPALGPGPTANALAAAQAATSRGIPVSFDGNYRARLWQCWDSNPRTILHELVGHADILFGNHQDIALLLGREFTTDSEVRRREAAEAAFAAYPRLQRIASTARHVIDSDHHRISARIDERSSHFQTDDITLAGIIDRIGAGDAFAAGVLHATRCDKGIEAAAADGLALTCLKHSLPGDAALFTRADLEAFSAGGADVRR